jgi:hypothetical protein
MANVVPISVALVQSLLHQNHIGISYARTSNFKMEPVIYVPLYSMVMPQFIITIIEAPFILTPIHIVDGVKSKPQTPRGKEFCDFA